MTMKTLLDILIPLTVAGSVVTLSIQALGRFSPDISRPDGVTDSLSCP